MNRRASDNALGSLGAWLHAVGGICTLAIILLAWLCFFRPIDAAARTSRDRAAQLRNVIDNARQIRNDHGELTEQLASAKEQAARLTDSVPDAPQEAEFLAQITQLADAVGLEIQDYRPNEKRDRQLYSILTVDLISAGTYASVCKFLSRLPEVPRHCAVESLQVTSKPEAEQCQVRITLRLYFGTKGSAPTAGDTNKEG